MKDEERQKCEVYTRVMGYHRPVTAFNPGKQQEYADRKHFKEHPRFSTQLQPSSDRITL